MLVVFIFGFIGGEPSFNPDKHICLLSSDTEPSYCMDWRDKTFCDKCLDGWTAYCDSECVCTEWSNDDYITFECSNDDPVCVYNINCPEGKWCNITEDKVCSYNFRYCLSAREKTPCDDGDPMYITEKIPNSYQCSGKYLGDGWVTANYSEKGIYYEELDEFFHIYYCKEPHIEWIDTCEWMDCNFEEPYSGTPECLVDFMDSEPGWLNCTMTYKDVCREKTIADLSCDELIDYYESSLHYGQYTTKDDILFQMIRKDCKKDQENITG